MYKIYEWIYVYNKLNIYKVLLSIYYTNICILIYMNIYEVSNK